MIQLFLMVPADAATNQDPKKRMFFPFLSSCPLSLLERSATTDDCVIAAPDLEVTRMQIRSTPLKGGLPLKTHIPPFPQDPSLFTFRNPTPKGERHDRRLEVEKSVAESQQHEKSTQEG